MALAPGRGVTGSHLFVVLFVALVAAPALGQEAPRHVEPDGPAVFDEPPLLTAAIDRAGRCGTNGGDRDDGFYPTVNGMISGAGWISAGPGYRQRLFTGRAIADAHAAMSWRGYMKANLVLEFPNLADGHLAAGVEALWQDSTQLNYFGIGPDSPEDPRTQYRLQTTNIATYARYRPSRWLALSSQVGWLGSPSISSPTGPFQPDDALNAQEIYANDPAMTIAEQPGFFHGELAITADTRDFNDHPTSGGLYRAAAGAYVASEQHYSFRRYEVEGLHAVSLFDGAWVLMAHGWGVFTQASPGREVPVYLMPSLGGSNTLRGYSNYRFHDRQLLLASAESRWPIFAHLDAAVFVDTGTVAARAGDLGFDKSASGFGLRVHAHRVTLARFDVAHAAEGWHVLFRSSDPFNLDRLKRWVAAAPFVP